MGCLGTGTRNDMGAYMNRFVDMFILPGLSILPERMDSVNARAMLFAIAMQESRFTHRRQVRGPARGYWQFELGGVNGVLKHPASRSTAEQVCSFLNYPADAAVVYEAIEHNDMLACAFARLLLWRLPEALPTRDNDAGAWCQYIDTWRPGKPHRQTWNDFYTQAWEAVI